MPLNLIPNDKRAQGQRGDDKTIRHLENAAALLLDLLQAISDNDDALLMWLDRKDANGATLTTDEMRSVLYELEIKAAKIHVLICLARTGRSEK